MDHFEDYEINFLAEKMQGSRAKTILDNEAFSEAIVQMKAALYKAWKESPVEHEKQREYYYYQIKAIDGMISNLQSMIDTGMMASIQLEQEDKKFAQTLRNKFFS